MRTNSASHTHPFALMMNPTEVLAAVERSGELKSLNRHVHHPLDKPLIPRVRDRADAATTDLYAYDQSIDAEDFNVDEIDDLMIDADPIGDHLSDYE